MRAPSRSNNGHRHGWPLLFLALSACAPLPSIPRRPDFTKIKEPSGALQTYYNWRLTPSAGGYRYGKLEVPTWQLPAFMDAQGDTVAAAWARKGNRMILSGWALAAALEGAAVIIGINAGGGDPAKGAWWVGLAPAGLAIWTFHWAGHGWFRRPAVAKYDLELKRELGLTKD